MNFTRFRLDRNKKISGSLDVVVSTMVVIKNISIRSYVTQGTFSIIQKFPSRVHGALALVDYKNKETVLQVLAWLDALQRERDGNNVTITRGKITRIITAIYHRISPKLRSTGIQILDITVSRTITDKSGIAKNA